MTTEEEAKPVHKNSEKRVKLQKRARRARRAVQNTERTCKDKWGPKVWRTGWTGIPFVLLDRQDELGLEPVDLCVLLQILKHWWDPSGKPYPSKGSIAKRIGKSEKTVQRSIRRMRDELGLLDYKQKIRVDGGKGPNIYSFDRLVARLEPLAEEHLERVSKKAG